MADGPRRAVLMPGSLAATAPTVLLFDLGGVLVENVGFDRLNGLLGKPVDAATLRDRWLASPSVRQFELGAIPAHAFAEAFVEEWGLPLAPSAFLDEFATWPKGFHRGAVALLDALRPRFRLACLSNSNALHWQRFDGFRDVFEVALSSHLLGEIKPDLACFKRALEACSVTADQVVFFDDSAANVTAARALGMRAFEVIGVDAVRDVLRKEGL